jgi:hypothetical protein
VATSRSPANPLFRLVMAGTVFALGASDLAAQRPSGPPGGGPLWISDAPLDESRRLLIVVDSASRRAAVYHVDVASGSLTLKSARDISWDLMLDEFNAQEPRPAALRNMLQAAGRPTEHPGEKPR